MDKFKTFLTFLNPYFGLIVIVFLTFVGAITFSLYRDYQASRFDKTITNQTIESNKAVREAVNANGAAISFDATRRSEDARRETTIKPKLDAARRQSKNSKADFEKALENYNEKKSDTKHLSRSDSDNCRELRRLFPNVRFDDCAEK